MKKAAYLFDSSSSYTQDIPEQDIYVVPINIQVDIDGQEKSFAENVDITQEEINKILLEKKDVKTSLVNPELLKEKVTNLLKDYEQVFYVPISSAISSTYEKSLVVMKQINAEYGADKFLVIKSNSVSYIARIVMDRFLQLYNGHNFEEVQNIINEDVDNNRYCAILFVNDLDMLIKGGRIKKVKGMIGKAMNLKLLILMGKNLEYYGKSLTYNGQITKAIDFFNSVCKKNNLKINTVGFVHDGLKQTDDKYFGELDLKNKFKNSLDLSPDVHFIDTNLPGVIKCHTGLNSLAIVIKLDI